MTKPVEIIVKAVDKASKDLKNIDKTLENFKKRTEKSAKPFKDLASGIGNIGIQAAMVAAPLVAMGIAAKKAFEFGQRGAEVAQTSESFDLLIEKVGATPNLLEELRAASRGTISDMSLMSSTATLLAGASGDLGTALANSTPKLMEIAKAANKLNPSLGDTRTDGSYPNCQSCANCG